jgi:hypothetical protein
MASVGGVDAGGQTGAPDRRHGTPTVRQDPPGNGAGPAGAQAHRPDGHDRWAGVEGAPPGRPSPTEDALLHQMAELQAQRAEQDKKLAAQEAKLAVQEERLAAQDRALADHAAKAAEREEQLSRLRVVVPALLLLARGYRALKDTDPGT